MPTKDRLNRPLADEASAIQKQIGYAERRLGRLGRDYGHRDLLKASKVLNALNHVLDFGAQYGPQLTGAVEDLLKEYGS